MYETPKLSHCQVNIHPEDKSVKCLRVAYRSFDLMIVSINRYISNKLTRELLRNLFSQHIVYG